MANRNPYVYPQTRAGIEQQNSSGYSSVNMWQPQHHVQPQANAVAYQQQLQLAEKQRQKEYFKQQQKLRLMAATNNKQPVNADKLIENLLETKDTFRLKANVQPSSSPAQASFSHPPPQLQSGAAGTSRQVNYSQAYQIHSSFQPGVSLPTGVSDCSGGVASRTFQETSGGKGNGSLQLPSWLTPQSPSLPALYRQVWSIVGIDKCLVDTSKIFPILLTSGLPTDVLGYIWSLANKKIAGQLTEDELYIVLALVGLAQNGCTFNNLGVLNLIPQAPIPNLNLCSLKPNPQELGGSAPVQAVSAIQSLQSSAPVQLGQQIQPVQSVQLLHPVTPVVPLDTVSLKDDDFQAFSEAPSTNQQITASQVSEEEIDDFSDFQSAITSEESVHDSPIHIKDIPVSPPPVSFQGVSHSDGLKSFTSLFSLGSSSRGVGSRLANHSLGAPRQAKSRHHKHHHHNHHHRNSQTSHHSMIANIPAVQPNAKEPLSVAPIDEDEFSDFQQAKDVESQNKDPCELFQKSSSKPYVLKESAIRSDSKQDNTLLFDSPVHIKVKPPVADRDMSSNTDTTSLHVNAEIPKLETPSVKSVASGPEFISVEEDKYSALRALSISDKEPPDVEETIADDFGDFLSAEPALMEDSFVALAARDVNPRLGETLLDNTSIWPASAETSHSVEFQVDDWGPVENPLNTSSKAKVFGEEFKTGIGVTGITSLAADLQGLNIKEENVSESNFFTFGDVTHSPCRNTAIDNGSKSSIEVSHSSKEIDPPQSESGPFDIKTPEDGDNDEFGDFIGPEAWSDEGKFAVKESAFEDPSILRIKDVTGDNQSVSSLELPVLSRHGSLPSLDLKIFPANDKTGMIHSWESSPQIENSLHGSVTQRSTNQEGVDLQIKEWCRCLQSCLQLLQAALATFTSISNDSVADEVVKSQEGRDYLLNLLEVYGICRRVKQSSIGVCNDSKLDSSLAEIDMTWSSMEIYFEKAEIKVSEMDLGCSAADVTQEHTPCGICLTSVGSRIVEDNPNNIYPLEYSGQVYHASCANLWVNCVDCRLPALASTGSLL